MRALVVEDDFGSRKMLQKLLLPYGECDIVIDGEEAVEAFTIAWESFRPYDVIFMDIMMPKLDGQEALKRIRKLERDLGVAASNEVRIVMTTVLDDPRNVLDAYNKGGATSYMVKPIDRTKLAGELERLGFAPKD